MKPTAFIVALVVLAATTPARQLSAQCATCHPAGELIPSCQHGPLIESEGTTCQDSPGRCTVYAPIPCGSMFALIGNEFLPTVFGSPGGHTEDVIILGDGRKLFKNCFGIVYNVEYSPSIEVEVRRTVDHIVV